MSALSEKNVLQGMLEHLNSNKNQRREAFNQIQNFESDVQFKCSFNFSKLQGYTDKFNHKQKGRGCFSYATAISVACHNHRIVDVVLEITNQKNGKRFNTKRLNRHRISIKIQLNPRTDVTKVSLGYRHRQLTQVKLYKGRRSAVLSCGRRDKAVSFPLPSKSQISGFRLNRDGQVINDIDFRYTTLSSDNPQVCRRHCRSSFLHILKVAHIVPQNKSTVRVLGIFNDKGGRAFEDPIFWSHWRMQGVRVGAAGKNIQAIQIVLSNIYFDNKTMGSLYGVKTPVRSKAQTVELDLKRRVQKIIIYLDGQCACGFVFVYNGGNYSKVSGVRTSSSKTFKLRDRENITGLKGNITRHRICNLGFTVVRSKVYSDFE